MPPSLPQFSATRFRSYMFRLPLFTRAVILIIILFWIASIQSVWDVEQWGALIPKEIGFSTSLSTIPALLYTFLERDLLRMNTTILGASIWVFILLAIEGVKTYRSNPTFSLGTVRIPTWTTPLITVLFVSFLVPNTSFLGHTCGLVVGGVWLSEIPSTARKDPSLDRRQDELAWQTSSLRVCRPENLWSREERWPTLSCFTWRTFATLARATLLPVITRKATLRYVNNVAPLADATTDLKSVMATLTTGLLLRRDPRILKLPPYLSFLCIVVGVTWLLLLPLNDYSRKTYISENALLPGQVHTYFAGSDQNIFRAFKHEVVALEDKDNIEVNDKLEEFFKNAGLKTARQKYEYRSAGEIYTGENIYAILHAPRGDATEAIVLVGSWRNMDGVLNQSGVALVITLASKAGPQAWVDAYHDTHMSPAVEALPLKSGALQGVVVIDYPFDHRFESIHIVYDGVNGQLPNLDLLNTVVSIASGQMGIPVSLQQMWNPQDTYKDRLQTMLRGMLSQGIGHAAGPHSSFIPYHVDAITLQPFGQGWQDEMAMGRVIESTFRSLNNLLEHLHQSFFFYLLMHAGRFVSIGTYLPSAMLIAVNFTIMAIFLWIRSGSLDDIGSEATAETDSTRKKPAGSVVQDADIKTAISEDLSMRERELFVPLAIVAGCHLFGVVPLYIFNHLPATILPGAFWAFAIASNVLPLLVSTILVKYFQPTTQQYQLIKAFSLLLLGMVLSTLATLNFSLAFLIGILAAPLTYVQPQPKKSLAGIFAFLISFIAPPTVLIGAVFFWKLDIGQVLKEAAFGWNVWGMTTQLVIWCVWWPAWLVGAISVYGQPRNTTVESNNSTNGKRLS
ncbi:hypothetical protein B7463_g12123, partial [Scytalidium lignicola]